MIQEEFEYAYVVETKSDVNDNPKIAGTTHNVFGIKEGVAITFLVKKNNSSSNKAKKNCKIYYISLEDDWRREEKIQWLRDNPLESIKFEKIEPNNNYFWLDNPDEENDFNDFLYLIDEDVKRNKRSVGAVFRMFSLGLVSARDEWVYDFNKERLEDKVSFLINSYNKDLVILKKESKDKIKEIISNREERGIKWSRAVINNISNKIKYKYNDLKIYKAQSRPYVKKYVYFASELNEMQYQQNRFFPCPDSENLLICVNHTSSKDFNVLAVNVLPDYHINGDANCVSLYTYDSDGNQIENITDWSLQQFQAQYPKIQITKQDIFYYTYAVLHSPQYRKKYEQNLKREFPHLPFYEDFTRWRDWGKALMDLHINYETQEPFTLERNDLDLTPKLKNKQNDFWADLDKIEKGTFIARPKTKLRADKTNGTIEIDSHTTLTGIPPLAWEYKLGNRSALEWILDQYKERTPKDATIAERFNTYKFEDYKEQVIDLRKRVANVSVKTMEIVNLMPDAD